MNVSFEGVTLLVDDVPRSRDFYLRLPGARLVHERPGQFALVQIGQARVQLLSARDLPTAAPRFHIEATSADVDALYQELRGAGVPTDGPPSDKAWGDRSFHVIDPDGNEIEVARPWQSAWHP
jgi:catechol 2,3-dioxygenase-like lactoylglutathione lyase family enzyme